MSLCNRAQKISKLFQNYPNPFNPSTTISYSLRQGGFVTLKVYNNFGQEVKSLVHEFQNAGEYRVNFDASHFASGIYLYKLSLGRFGKIKTMIFLQ